MNDVRKIKQLQSQLNILISDAEVLKIEVSSKQREYNQKLQAINKLQEVIDSLNNNSNIKISEHAIIRYMERVKGLDISEIEKEILTEEVLVLIEKLGGSGKYPVKDFQIVMKDYTVTTIV
jgi:translation initiation factor 2B subunit (eIF-2B alpha/beta/delta family)